MLSPRAERVADAAISLLADRGMRGLTHRAADEVAGLPPGSTSNLARTRAALLELALARLTQLDGADYAEIIAGAGTATDPGLDALTGLLARSLHHQLTEARRRTVARYELALEATRRPELRAVYDEIGRRYREPAVALLAAAGSPDPVRHGRQLVAFADGILFDAVVGAGETPDLPALLATVREVLRGMLGR